MADMSRRESLALLGAGAVGAAIRAEARTAAPPDDREKAEVGKYHKGHHKFE